MKKIIREKYENGVLVSREIESTGFRFSKIAKLVIHLVVALSLATLALVAVNDSLNAAAVGQEAEIADTTCPSPGFRS